MPKPKRDSSNSHGMYIVMGERSSPKSKAGRGRKKTKLPKVQVQRKDETPPILEEDRTSSPDGRISFSPVKYGS